MEGHEGILMASPNTLNLRVKPQFQIRVLVCAFCLRRDAGKTRVGGTLRRSRIDGLLYHVEHLPERRQKVL